MAEGDNDQLVMLAVLGGAGFVAYKFAYQPWQQRQQLQAEIERQTRENVARGMGVEEAAQKAIAAGCQIAAATYGVPPGASGAVCSAVGVLAEKAVKKTVQGAIIAGKAIGSGVATGAKAVGGAVVTGGKAVGTAAKFVGYTAPKAVVYDAPKAVVTTVASGAATGAKAVGSAVVSLFGGGSSKVCRARNNKDVFPNDMRECQARYGITNCNDCGMLYDLNTRRWPWTGLPPTPAPAKAPVGKPAGMRGLGNMVAAAKAARRQLGGGARPAPNPFAEHARRREGAKVATGRKRRSLAGLPGAGRARRVSGAEFYTRHLR